MWWEILYCAVAVLVFFLVYRELQDEPFLVRFGVAALCGVGWGSVLIMILVFLGGDAVAFISKAFRK